MEGGDIIVSEDTMGRDMENDAKWRKENLVQYILRLNKTNEKDVYEWLAKQPNRRQYLINLIRKDMKRG